MTTFGPTDKEELETRDQIPEHVKQAEKIRKATATLAGVSATLQIQGQRIEMLFERLDRVEKLYMTLLGEMEQFEQQYVTALRTQLNGGPTVRD